MKYYVYTYDDMLSAMNKVAGATNRSLNRCDEAGRVWHTFHFIDHYHLIYPCGPHWHRQIAECFLPDVFSPTPAAEADYFVVPLAVFIGDTRNEQDAKSTLLLFENEVLNVLVNELPFWSRNKGRHVWFNVGDGWVVPPMLKSCAVFKTSCHRNTPHHAFPYDVLLNRSDIKPIESAEFVCSFAGNIDTHYIRKQIPFILGQFPGKTYFESTSKFFGFLEKDEQTELQNRWTETLNNSQFVLCPRGNGLSSIRFFETISFGRIPIVIANDAKLPLANKIDYEKFTIKVPEGEMDQTHRYVEAFLQRHSISEASQKARQAWEDNFSTGKLKHLLDSCLPPGGTKLYA